MKKTILAMIIALSMGTMAMAQDAVEITLPMTIQHSHLSIPYLQTDGTNWTISIEMSIPRNHVYTNLNANIVVDRMDAKIGPFLVPDAMMQVILGEDYQLVNSIVAIGGYEPSGNIKTKIITAIGGEL